MSLNLLPKDLIKELLRYFSLRELMVLRCLNKLWEKSANYVLEVEGLSFSRFENNFDRNGVLYFIGTAFGLHSKWTLRSVSKFVKVSSSTGERFWEYEGLEDDRVRVWNAPIVHLLDRQGYRLFLSGSLGIWFQIDLGPHISVRPTKYTLRHNSSQGRALRNWRFSGSVDGDEWFVIREHVDDKTLHTAPGSSATWDISNDLRRSFRYFRVIKTGPDTAEMVITYFHLSGIEIYGTLTLHPKEDLEARIRHP